MNYILYTKNFQAKTIGLIIVLTFFFSCSPTVYILDHKPKFGGQLYKNNVVSKTQNKINNSGDNPALLKNGVEELTTYAFGFLMEESDRAMLDNYSKAKELESQAHQYFSEAVGYGESALSILYEEYIDWISDNNGDIVLTPNSEDLELFYWTAAAYGGAISSSGGNPSWIIKLPRVGKLLNSIVAIDSSWNHGAALVALISFTMNNPLISSDEANKISKNLFNAAVDASQGLDMGPYLTYAESVSKVRQDKEGFIKLLNEALKIDILSAKGFQLTNTISRNRAEWLLENIDEFFY
ncbi:MAG: TRAP transporter TatT component family protein [Candidatus Neomarinimicrobiota bacterium]|nr:TRAP transporter TatT component family protein [Candidatus Neomarinimicrobiota bacterium]